MNGWFSVVDVVQVLLTQSDNQKARKYWNKLAQRLRDEGSEVVTNCHRLKRDKYKSARGGYSRLLNLHCRKCNTVFAEYQKDGPGNLRRLYMDRIMAPKKLVGLENKSIKEVSPVKCPKCGFIVGMPYVYKKEKQKSISCISRCISKTY